MENELHNLNAEISLAEAELVKLKQRRDIVLACLSLNLPKFNNKYYKHTIEKTDVTVYCHIVKALELKDNVWVKCEGQKLSVEKNLTTVSYNLTVGDFYVPIGSIEEIDKETFMSEMSNVANFVNLK